MKTTFVATVLAYFAAQAAANGSITACTGNDGAGCTTFTGLVPPNNCNGGCAKFAAGTMKSAKEAAADSGYCFTVYTDVNCNNGARRVPKSFINGNFRAFSYDCC